MGLMDWNGWSIIFGLSFLSVGGLLVWAYGDSMRFWEGRTPSREERVMRLRFNGVIIYSTIMIVAGIVMLAGGTFALLSHA